MSKRRRQRAMPTAEKLAKDTLARDLVELVADADVPSSTVLNRNNVWSGSLANWRMVVIPDKPEPPVDLEQ